MGNPYYIPRDNTAANAAMTLAGMKFKSDQAAKDRALTARELGMRERKTAAEYGDGTKPGLAQRRVAVAEQGLSQDSERLAVMKQKNAIDAQALPADQRIFSKGHAMVLKSRLDAVGLEMPTVFNVLHSHAETGASRGQIYDSMRENWPFLRSKTLDELEKQFQKKMAQNPAFDKTPEGQRLIQIVDDMGRDTEGATLDHLFKETLAARQARAEAAELERMNAEPDQWGPLQPDRFGNLVQTNAKTGKVERVSTPQRGMVAEVGPDGAVRLTTNADTSGAVQTPVGAKTALFKDYVANQQQLDAVAQIKSLYEPEFLTYGGAIKGTVDTIKNKMDPEQRSQFQTRRAAFKSAVGRAFLTFRKWATGVAGGPAEMAEIKRISFSEDDSPQDFEAKVQLYESLTRRLNARIKAALNEGINNDAAYKKYVQEHPLGSIPTIQQRGEQLEAQGYGKDQILQILTQEGYIAPRR